MYKLCCFYMKIIGYTLNFRGDIFLKFPKKKDKY